ncbi:hypothetical protein Ddye_008404 [Dipteronia dyeriana]|uniref:Glutaredoxin domain-containing protein n=1 Tax=Dipteronia dyeriana TaxID=168575 RepID=A0AAD9X9T3_9ROSI|nr:hypothetical protein Ddye_008404 [Dipteronia dyeriana]
MKGVKGRLLKKLNFIPTVNSLKQGLPLHQNSSQKLPNYRSQSISIYRNHEDHNSDNIREIVLGNIGVSGDHKGTKDLKDDQEMELELEFNVVGDKENVRFLLQSFKVPFDERDISLHLEFRDELWRLLGSRVIPSKLFIKGRYIGGADEVVGLHEQGNLTKLLEGIPPSLSNCPCNGCANIRFVVCFNCNGCCKVFKDGDIDNDEILYVRCPDCNENGLLKCPICC